MDIADLFYKDPETTKSYKAPSGEIKGNITLKRSFEIVNSKLMRMFNLYRLLPPGVEVKRLRESPALTKLLERPKEFELEDIVATIQQEQHDKIAAKRDQVMIVEGVAGSGKSEVGLHRVAYLAYPGREISEKISPENVIFLGPTRIFLGFISNLLPGLRVQKVKQTTILEWLISILSKRIRLQQKDKLLEKYLSSNMRNLEKELEVAQFKSSLTMARLIARYVKVLHNKFLNSASQIDIDYSTSISRSRVQHLLKAPFEYPLNEERTRAVARIGSEISKIGRLYSKEYSPATWKRVQL